MELHSVSIEGERNQDLAKAEEAARIAAKSSNGIQARFGSKRSFVSLLDLNLLG